MSLLFLQFTNLFSWFILYLIALVVVGLSCGFLPFILMLVQFGFSFLAQHILLNHMAALVFNNFSSVFFKLLQSFAFWTFIIFVIVSPYILKST